MTFPPKTMNITELESFLSSKRIIKTNPGIPYKFKLTRDNCFECVSHVPNIRKQVQTSFGSIISDTTLLPRIIYFLLHPNSFRTVRIYHLCKNPSCCNPAHFLVRKPVGKILKRILIKSKCSKQQGANCNEHRQS